MPSRDSSIADSPHNIFVFANFTLFRSARLCGNISLGRFFIHF